MLGSEQIWRPESRGFDGQFYHYMAHDPLLTHGMAGAVDLPRLRYGRILVPALAYAVAFGRPDRAHIIETGTESFRFRRTVEGRKKR